MVTFHTDLDGVSADDLGGFFEGWPNPPSSSTLLRLLRETDHFVVARQSEGRVVGFVSALTDGLLSAYITLLEVTPEHRHQGIGSELVRRILDEMPDIYMVDAACDPDVASFYERLGFTRSTAVSIRRYERQAGPE